MKELLSTLEELVRNNVAGVKEISTLPELANMFVLELDDGKKYAVSLLELN